MKGLKGSTEQRVNSTTHREEEKRLLGVMFIGRGVDTGRALGNSRIL